MKEKLQRSSVEKQMKYLMIEGSSDGSTWKPLIDKSDGTEKVEWDQTLHVPDNTSARYLKLTITDYHGARWWGVKNIQIKN